MIRHHLILAATLAGVLAGPALAQTAQTAPAPADTAQTPADPAAPAAQAPTPMPDAGMKKTAPTHVHHRVHHRSHAKPADTGTPPAGTTQR